MIRAICKLQATAFTCLSLILFISCSVARPQTRLQEAITRIEKNIYTISATGQDTGEAKTVDQRMAALGLTGMSVAVFDEGKII
ncbi:MAG: hypothetical protein INR73_00340 [Williamsia sp.]|nr:hypothetical protein [Williamsia sp.]